MSTAALVDAATLRAAGRAPAMPCRVRLTDGREIELLRSLRVLPGKRIVAEGRLDGVPVLAKMFIADGAERHLRRERDGIAALAAAGIDTPELLGEGALDDNARILLTRFLSTAENLGEVWNAAPRPPGAAAALALLAPAVETVGRLHAAGLTQSDLHLGNFLRDGERLFVIDGDAVERHAAPLRAGQAGANLAILFAQLPASWDAHLAPLLAAYHGASGIAPDAAALAAEIRRVRDWRLEDVLKKSVRECSLFAVRQTATRFTSVVRADAGTVAPVLADPDAAIAAGTLLKDGNSSTVARIDVAGRTLVIKRYNLKSAGHALSRLWRPSRAWNAWQSALRLRFLGIATPAPLALIEQRWGPLRRRAWIITEYRSGQHLRALLSADAAPPPDIARALSDTFAALHQARIAHGDLKASNLLWDGQELLLLDLDATTAHRDPASFARAWQRDRARLLRNWPADSTLTRWLDQHLPAA